MERDSTWDAVVRGRGLHARQAVHGGEAVAEGGPVHPGDVSQAVARVGAGHHSLRRHGGTLLLGVQGGQAGLAPRPHLAALGLGGGRLGHERRADGVLGRRRRLGRQLLRQLGVVGETSHGRPGVEGGQGVGRVAVAGHARGARADQLAVTSCKQKVRNLATKRGLASYQVLRWLQVVAAGPTGDCCVGAPGRWRAPVR